MAYVLYLLIIVSNTTIQLCGGGLWHLGRRAGADRSWLLMRLMHYCQLQALDVADAQKTDIRLLAHTLDLIDEVRDFLYFGNPTPSGLEEGPPFPEDSKKRLRRRGKRGRGRNW